MLFSLAWSAKLCPTYQVIITLHNSPSSMAKDTSLLETATPWHSADVFTWYFWRQSDAHFRLRAIASHDTEKRDDDADWYRYVYWMLLIYHPIPVSHIYIYCVQLGYLQSCEHLHHFGCKIASFFCIAYTEGMGWNQQSGHIRTMKNIQACLGQCTHHHIHFIAAFYHFAG